MPNFCGISATTTADHFLINRQTARVNAGEDGYDYSTVKSTVPRRKLKFVFIQNNEDEDIKQLKVIKKVTNETLMNWSINATGQMSGWEVYTQGDVTTDYGGDFVFNGTTIFFAIGDGVDGLAGLLSIGGLD